jgi:uncharacterized protein YwqG
MNIFKKLFGKKEFKSDNVSSSGAEEDLNGLEALLEARKLQAIHLAPIPVSQSLTKVGGSPDIDSSFEWPSWNDQPMSFLAQIDLSSLPYISNLEKLPSAGMLYFFYDQEQSTWGFDPKDLGSWRVVFREAIGSITKISQPEGLPTESIFRETYLSPSIRSTYPSFERLGINVRSYSNEAFDIEDNLRHKARPEGPEHQIGGYPNPIQNDTMELEAQLASNGLYCGNSSGYQDPRATSLSEGSKDWLLLLQIDTDEKAGMMWGDCGMLYFWVRKLDLENRDFSKVWMVLQCG